MTKKLGRSVEYQTAVPSWNLTWGDKRPAQSLFACPQWSPACWCWRQSSRRNGSERRLHAVNTTNCKYLWKGGFSQQRLLGKGTDVEYFGQQHAIQVCHHLRDARACRRSEPPKHTSRGKTHPRKHDKEKQKDAILCVLAVLGGNAKIQKNRCKKHLKICNTKKIAYTQKKH